MAGVGAAASGVVSDMNRGDYLRTAAARTQAARTEGYATGVNGANEAMARVIGAVDFVNEQLVRQRIEGRKVIPYFGATILNGSLKMDLSEAKVPIIIENPIVPLGASPMIEGDPSSFWLLYLNWRFPDGTPYFRPFWPGGRDATMKLADSSNPEQQVDLALSTPEPGKLDYVRVVDPTTGEPIPGTLPVRLIRGIPSRFPAFADPRHT